MRLLFFKKDFIVYVSGCFVGTHVCTPCACAGQKTVLYVLLQTAVSHVGAGDQIHLLARASSAPLKC